MRGDLKMENTILKGPRLSDGEFFAALDDSKDALKKAMELYESGDTKGAYRAFADYVREGLDPERYFKLKKAELVPEFTESLKASAERAIRHEVTVLGTSYAFNGPIDWEFNATPNGYKEWTWHLSYVDMLSPLSRAYRATGDEKYVKSAVEILMSWIGQALVCDYSTSPYETKCWRTLECGHRMPYWFEFLHSCKDSSAMSDEVFVTIFKSLYEHAMRITHKYTHGNWLFHELSGIAHISVILPVFRECAEWREGMKKKIEEAFNVQIHPDGSQYELAPGYHIGILAGTSNIERMSRAYGFSFTEVFYDKMRASIDYFVKMTMANGNYPAVNDSATGKGSAVLSRFCPDYYPSEVNTFIMTEGKEGCAPDFKSCVLPYAGFAIFRTGWGKTDSSAFFDAGKFGRDHHHEDKLNFLIFNSEKPVIYEAGTYAYDSSPMRVYATQTEGHNTVKVDGQGQNRRATHIWRDPECHVTEGIKYLESERLDYSYGVYDKEYGKENPEMLATHKRHVLLLKKPKMGAPIYIAADIMESDESRTYEALWHINTESVTVNGSEAFAPEVSIFTSGFDKIECYKGQMEPTVRGYLCTGTDLGNYYEAPELVCVKRGETCEFATLFALGNPEECQVSAFEYEDGIAKITYKNGSFDEIDMSALYDAAEEY